MIDKKNILGVEITNATKEEILEYIIKSLENLHRKYYIVTPNPEFLVLANKNSKYKNILNNAELALADGIGVILAGKIIGKTLKQRITGVQLLESLCGKIAEKPITVGFLGGRAGIAEKTAERLRFKYPSLKISFISQEWNEEGFIRTGKLRVESEKLKNKNQKEARENSQLLTVNSQLRIDILFVAFGLPKQEIWISENLDKIPVKIAIGVGGAFDYISGKVGRAPKWIQDLGFEWLYRLIRQPWRIKRQLSLLKFIWLILKEKINTN